jgi:hypothetical protein
MNAIGDKAAIAGIGQTPFSRSLGRSEFDMAIEAPPRRLADIADGALRAHWQVPGVQALPAAKTGTCPQPMLLRKSSAV